MGKTTVDVDGDRFLIDGRPTYPGRYFRGHRIEGLLLNARMVQGVFDDLNPETRSMFDYPDGPFDAERNTSEFIAAMPGWRSAGLLAFTDQLPGRQPAGLLERTALAQLRLRGRRTSAARLRRAHGPDRRARR